jgi:hypothetical protein
MEMDLEFMSQLWKIRAAEPRELNGDLGQCDPTTNTIIIDPNLPASVMLQTLTHEWVHLIELTMNLHLTEQQVDSMAAGILHLLSTNPELLALYQQRLEEEQDNV